jgi:hypothetical protein
MRARAALACALVLAWTAVAHAGPTGFETVDAESAAVTPAGAATAAPSLALPAAPVLQAPQGHGALAATGPVPAPVAKSASPSLGGDRARILLRSLTVPGWGEASIGRRGSATVFLTAEVAIWASFTSFRIQEQLRRDSYQQTAQLFAGIDLTRRDEEFKRIVGSYLSSDEYNQFVVARDAANLYLDPDHPDYAGYHAYIDAHSLKGADTWNWDSVDHILRYRGQRKDAQRAALRANTALAFAVVNRLISAVHASRLHSMDTKAADARSWNLEVAPAPGDDAMAFRVGVRTRF